MTPDGLPSFKNPPVNEVVLGMQFSGVEFDVVRMGDLYRRFAIDFPGVQQVPPLQPSFESFAPAPPSFAFASPTFNLLPRLWFVSEDDERLIQLQSDRLIVNWRRREGGGPYPRYGAVRKMFVAAMDKLLDYVEIEKLGELSPNQCDTTYFNHISLSDTSAWARPGVWLNLWQDEEDAGEGVQFATRHILKNDDGQPVARLITTVEGAQVGEEAILSLNLAVRGKPLAPNPNGVLNFFDMGRKAIVARFAAITTPSAHDIWKRDQ